MGYATGTEQIFIFFILNRNKMFDFLIKDRKGLIHDGN